MIARHAHAARASTPLVLAHGRLDSVVPFGHFERLKEQYPGASAVVWEDAGHNVALTHPQHLASLTADR